MKDITDSKLYAFSRLLKEGKPFASITTTKANHWNELITILLDDKIDWWFSKLSKEKTERSIEVQKINVSKLEFEDKLNSYEIKNHHILSIREDDEGKLDVWYTKKKEQFGVDKNE
jgi:hypothetical protein